MEKNNNSLLAEFKKPITIIGIIITVLFLSYLIYFFVNIKHEKKDFYNMTNKEMDQFLEWKEKDQQKKKENENYFK